MPELDDTLLPLPEAARQLDGVSYSSLWRATASGTLPYRKLSDRIFVRRSDLERWAKDRRQ